MNAVSAAVKILRSGGLVAFPTETVYGLGADATNPAAINRIFAAKGRPSTNPLIIHVADATVARRYAAHWPDLATQLTNHFWPGPLTLVLAKTPDIAPEATAGLDTLGLRAPEHPLTLQLLREFDGPLAGPSANRSTHLSPTTAEHVRLDLGNAVDLILDGGPCRVGIESTVLDLTRSCPTILRPGGISRQQIESIIGPVDLFTGFVSPNTPAASPGQHAVHYAPRSPAYRFNLDQLPHVIQWCQSHPQASASILSIGSLPFPKNLSPKHRLIEMAADAAAYAHRIYAALHEADAQGPSMIWVQTPPDTPEWNAVRDRLHRATRPI